MEFNIKLRSKQGDTEFMTQIRYGTTVEQVKAECFPDTFDLVKISNIYDQELPPRMPIRGPCEFIYSKGLKLSP